MMDLRWAVGAIFTIFAFVLVSVNLQIWATFPAGAGVYILASKLWDELGG